MAKFVPFKRIWWQGFHAGVNQAKQNKVLPGVKKAKKTKGNVSYKKYKRDYNKKHYHDLPYYKYKESFK